MSLNLQNYQNSFLQSGPKPTLLVKTNTKEAERLGNEWYTSFSIFCNDNKQKIYVSPGYGETSKTFCNIASEHETRHDILISNSIARILIVMNAVKE